MKPVAAIGCVLPLLMLFFVHAPNEGPGAAEPVGIKSHNYALARTVASFEKTTHHYRLKYSDRRGAQLTTSIDFVPGPLSFFDGWPAISVKNIVHNVVKFPNGRSAETKPFIEYSFWSLLGHHPLGFRTASTFTRIKEFSGLPANAKIGQSGQLEELNAYPDQDSDELEKHISIRWHLDVDPEAADVAMLCLQSKIILPETNLSKDGKSFCYRIAANDEIVGLAITLPTNTGTLTLR